MSLTFSLNGEGGGDFMIAPDETAELPSENAHVQSLVAQGYLSEVKPLKKDK